MPYYEVNLSDYETYEPTVFDFDGTEEEFQALVAQILHETEKAILKGRYERDEPYYVSGRDLFESVVKELVNRGIKCVRPVSAISFRDSIFGCWNCDIADKDRPPLITDEFWQKIKERGKETWEREEKEREERRKGVEE